MRDDFQPSSRAARRDDTAKRRTLLDSATARQRSVRPAGRAPRVLDLTPPRGTPAVPPHRSSPSYFPRTSDVAAQQAAPARRPARPDPDDPSISGRRRRDQTAARPLVHAPPPARTVELAIVDDPPRDPPREPSRAPYHEPAHVLAHVAPQVFTPERTGYRQPTPVRRPRLDTRALVRRARSPWSLTRAVLALLALSAALWIGIAHVGEPSQPLMADSWLTTVGAHAAAPVTSLVQPETQGMRPDLYDNYSQFNDWWDAACSAAVMSEVLTAWGQPHATIGHLIDVMQPDISLNGGLLTPHGFVRGAGAFGYRADIGYHLTYKQMEYITNVLGLPVIVNVRISYGYYHFFSGGHFLVMTGGDDQGLRIVDSSEYYIHYLPKDTFDSMFTGVTAVIVPNGYNYSVPAI